MGIINITPDSFYTGNRHEQIDQLLAKAEQMWEQGATIIDIGGQSTRPGSKPITADEELKRVMPAIEALIKTYPG
ncbi:MAG: dihydropteroate synthase, partial [Bacteroidota bacterium]|nr:dihydropteroate synthase [Bacteroidota bacterium]